jgi:predicted RNase H-like nuclease (RuvC/YqgF family)
MLFDRLLMMLKAMFVDKRQPDIIETINERIQLMDERIIELQQQVERTAAIHQAAIEVITTVGNQLQAITQQLAEKTAADQSIEQQLAAIQQLTQTLKTTNDGLGAILNNN